MSKPIEQIYYDLHKYPELSYQEFKTTKYIINYLSQYDLKIHKLEPTGIIAVIDKGHDKTIAYRADLDALPIKEQNSFEYISQNEGIMHACGHDGHMSILLKFISDIFETNLVFNKNLMFIFQPAEEVDAGAKIVLNNKFFKHYNIEKIFGIHLWPELKSGYIGLKDGVLMGTNIPFKVEIMGKSAHVCTPQKGIDTMQIISEINQSFNYLISKSKSPFEPLVISIGKINGGIAANIIMESAILEGTVRAVSDETLEETKDNILNLLKGIELKYNCKIVFKQTEMTYVTVVNSPKIINEVENMLVEEGDLQYEKLDKPTLACEDFGFYTKKYEAAFFFLGTFDNKHCNMLHTVNFSFDLNILNKGVKLYEKLLQRYGQ